MAKFRSQLRLVSYIVSYQTGYIEDRWKLGMYTVNLRFVRRSRSSSRAVSLLWQNHISADLAYESGVPPNSSLEGTCEREGILWVTS